MLMAYSLQCRPTLSSSWIRLCSDMSAYLLLLSYQTFELQTLDCITYLSLNRVVSEEIIHPVNRRLSSSGAELRHAVRDWEFIFRQTKKLDRPYIKLSDKNNNGTKSRLKLFCPSVSYTEALTKSDLDRFDYRRDLITQNIFRVIEDPKDPLCFLFSSVLFSSNEHFSFAAVADWAATNPKCQCRQNNTVLSLFLNCSVVSERSRTFTVQRPGIPDC